MKKRQIIMGLTLLIISILIFNCAGTRPPGWYEKPPMKENYRYEAATAQSRDMQMAVDKATLDASAKLAGQIESDMSGYVKRAREESGFDLDSRIIDRFSEVQEQVITTSLTDYRVAKKKVGKEWGGTYRAYVLIEWDEGAAQERLLKRIKENQELYDAMRATELFGEMERKVEAYRERQGQ